MKSNITAFRLTLLLYNCLPFTEEKSFVMQCTACFYLNPEFKHQAAPCRKRMLEKPLHDQTITK